MIKCELTLDDQRRKSTPKFEPTTILVTAFPAVGKEAAWEQALGDLIRASLAFPGHLGTIVLKPESPATRTYRIMTKWDSTESMLRWRESAERRQRVERLSTLEAKTADIQHLTGLETWFDVRQHEELRAIVPPPKYKVAAIVWLAVYVAVVPMINVLRAATADLPPMISSAIGVTASVVLMTWVVMPVLNWMFRHWLYPTGNVHGGGTTCHRSTNCRGDLASAEAVRWHGST